MGVPLIPYPAWFFYAADDTDEVNREYRDGIEFAERVMVVAAEANGGRDRVWFIRDGLLENRDSWQLRAVDVLNERLQALAFPNSRDVG